MDPTANLEEQLRLAAQLIADPNWHPDLAPVLRLAELVQALDEWLRRGGFLPAGWAKPRDLEQAVRDVAAILDGQLDQGNENAARHVVACIDDLGR